MSKRAAPPGPSSARALKAYLHGRWCVKIGDPYGPAPVPPSLKFDKKPARPGAASSAPCGSMKSPLQYKERIEPCPDALAVAVGLNYSLSKSLYSRAFVANPALRAFAPKWVAAAGRTPDAISSNPCRRHQGIDLGAGKFELLGKNIGDTLDCHTVPTREMAGDAA